MGVGPRWTRGEIEPPAGEKNMGTWTAAVYTAEQQARLGVNERGEKVSAGTGAAQEAPREAGPSKPAVAAEQPGSSSEQAAAARPAYARALLQSPKLLEALCRKFFKKYDDNQNGLLDFTELLALSVELHESLDVPTDIFDDHSALRESIRQYNKGPVPDALGVDDFSAWFASLLRYTVEATGGQLSPKASDEQTSPRMPRQLMVNVTIKTLSGQEHDVKVHQCATVAELRAAAATALGAEPWRTHLAAETGVLLREGARLEELGIESGDEVTAIVASTLKVKRHVYNARGGTPPYRGHHLTASDTVDVQPDRPLSEQLQTIVPHDGYPGGDAPFGIRVLKFNRNVLTPRTWDGWGEEVDLAKTPLEELGVAGTVELAVLVPMRGLD